MEGIIAVITIVLALVKMVNETKKVKKNAPGQTAAPQKTAVRPPAASAPRMRTEPVRTPAAPTVKPTVTSPANPQPSVFWQQISEALKEELGSEKKDRGHEAVVKMPEGDSRECEHGSIGGSIAYDGHADGGEGRAKGRRADLREEEARTQPTDALYRPAMNAQEMRRAVVMAEILKRPQERMAEQARRWSVR